MKAANLRATAWMWFCACRNCGESTLDNPMRDVRLARGKHEPMKYCLACSWFVLSRVLDIKDVSP